MDYFEINEVGSNTVLSGVRHFDLEEILECGQCFRWNKTGTYAYEGIVQARQCKITQDSDTITFYDTTIDEFEALWSSYFDFDRDYALVKQTLEQDEVMCRAIAFCPGMRVLRQEPWEALCSFIISQNNNLGRIKGIVALLCTHFGTPIPGGHAFPTPEQLAACSVEDLAVIRSGFRAKYILDAARQVASGELALEPLYTLPLDEARAQLRRIRGVGPKVAECALLYGFARTECVPVDVWIDRALTILYPNGLPEAILPVAGLGQQYLFHYMRMNYKEQKDLFEGTK